jgi:glycerol-3-phosphate dehydrogenase
LVIGGGATGLGIAWDASLRGLKTLLVEQSDLGEGTSGRYHGLLHSGGRYVVSDPPTARECIAENRVLREIAASAIENTSGFFLQTPADPGDFVETWARAAAQAGLRHQEVQAAEVLRREPNLTPSILRAFETNDAALDSFDLLHLLQKAIESAGGGVYLHTRVTDFIFDGDRICGAQALSLSDQTSKTIGADLVVNATGPWAAQLTALAGIELPLSLGKGSMLAMSSRLVRSVVNRCRPPGDGDIIVPIGTVSVLGTTDVPVTSPNELRPEPWELDLLLAEAENIIPKIGSHRMLRAWSGIRPLLSNTPSQSQPRERTRAHSVIDHETRDGVPGLITVIGGKLTTFRLMAEETVDVVCDHLSLSTPCSTAETCLPESPRGYFQLPDRLPALAPGEPLRDGPELLCECELVTHQEALDSLETQPDSSIDDLRRDHRLGMGPCQGGYCTLRAAAAMADPTSPHTASQALTGFLHERWRGIRDLPWGHSLRQIEHNRRINLELLAAHSPVEAR